MKTYPANVTTEKNKISTTSAWYVLLQITLTDTEESAGPTVFRLAGNNDNVVFDGYTWTAFPFRLSVVGSNSDGEIERVKLEVSNVTRLLTPYLRQLDGGLGSDVKIIVVNSAYLNEDYSATEIYFSVQGCRTNPHWVTWTLGMPSPLNQRFPFYRYIAAHCPHRYGTAAEGNIECGVSSATKTTFPTCNRTFTQCLERANEIFFGGYLGMNRGSFRIA